MDNPYQQRIIAFYTARSDYDSDFTRDRALRHVSYAPPQPGQHILDVATGTGFVAMAVAEIVGETGSVIGVDFTKAYLEKAQAKIDQAGLSNIRLVESDEAKFTARPAQFDGIYCSSAIVLFPDIPATLQRWFTWLKPGGFVAFTCSTDTSFLTPIIIQACQSQGIDLPNLHHPLGTPDRCQTLLQTAGFQQVQVNLVDFGKWLSLEEAKRYWNGRTWFHTEDPLPNLPLATLDAIKADFDRQIELIQTPEGIWQENLSFYVTARKPIRLT
jgi:arsenite methyltransferase